MNKFEYKTVYFDMSKYYRGLISKMQFDPEELDALTTELGEQGWELVAVNPGDLSGATVGVFLFFKRLKTRW